MIAVLLLDIEGAFPNAVTERLLHNMCMRQLPEPYMNFIDCMLADQQAYQALIQQICLGLGQRR